MNILLNFYPVSSGGGQQVASNFLKIIKNHNLGHSWFILCGKGSELDKLANLYFPKNHIYSYPYSYKDRIILGIKIKKVIDDFNIDLIYNYAPTLPVKDVPQVVRSVYSNLYFPEIDFWHNYSFFVRMKKKVIDFFRLKQTLRADGLIFENKIMLERAHNLFNYSLNSMLYIEPSVSSFDESELNSNYAELERVKKFKILYLSSWYMNKNIILLPEVAQYLKENNAQIEFILSLDKNNPVVAKKLVSKIEKLNLNNYFRFIGKVEAVHVHQIVKLSDAMILLSKLECFSSNVIEAFYFEKPLVISDEPWARSACGDGALFVDRDDPKEIGKVILKLLDDQSIYNEQTQKGKKRLQSFNSPIEKVEKQVAFLEFIYNKNLLHV